MAKILLKNISLSYPIYEANARSLKRAFMSNTAGGLLRSENNRVIVNALDHISFELKKNDRLGLIGHNGAGKSTLLRVLASVYEPQTGHIEVQGRVSALLDMMLGMDFEATGYENIKIRGILLGLSNKEIKEMIPDIVEFTEIGDYLKMPVKTYSSGMAVRLAFAISTAIHPEIFLVDEVIGAGDAYFMKKAAKRMENLIHKSDILVLSSHDNTIIRKFCNKVMVLEHGKIKAFGDTESVLNEYGGNGGNGGSSSESHN